MDVLPTEKIAEFVISTEFEHLPAEAVRTAKAAIIDCLACALAAVPDPITEKLLKVVRAENANPTSGIVGSGFRTSALYAAFLNGTMAHALDLDDVNESMRGHPSVPIVPVVFALGEELNLSGKHIIAGYVVGFEVEAKIGRGINVEHSEKGWHTTCTLGTLGATAASAKLLRLNSEETRISLGIGASQAGGLRANFGTMTKPFHAGKAAQNGILAAKLAGAGFTSNPDILESVEGFCDLFCGKEKYSLHTIAENLGNPFDIVSPGVIFKIHPTCLLTHPAIDIILDIKNKRRLEPVEIKRVRCGVGYRSIRNLPYHSPQTPLEGKFSLEFCIALSIVKGKANIDQFTHETLSDTWVQKLMKNIEVYVHPELRTSESLSREFTVIDIELKNGERISGRMETPKGVPLNNGTFNGVLEKYRVCGKRALADDVINESLDLLQRIDELPSIRNLMNLLCKIET